jgi:hypothetical protein
MVTYVCMTFGYTPAVALALPVVQFFTLHREGRKLRDIEHTRDMIDLASVATVAGGGGKQFEAVTAYFRNRGNVAEVRQEEIARAVPVEDAANAMRGFVGGLH